MSFAGKSMPNFCYLLDNIGNREQASHNSITNDYEANNLNQYTNVSGTNLTFDLDGNTLSSRGFTYTWNGENRLVQASNSTTVLSFSYDYMGRRFSKVVEGSETKFIYDGWNLVSETSSSVTNHYTWGLDLSQSLQGAGGVGGLLSVSESDGNAYFPVQDANGNITGYVDENTNVVAVYVYDAFGGIVTSSGAKKDDFAFRFSTKPWEEELEAYSFIFRYYHPDMGRWLSRDPIGEMGGLVLYGFVANDSIDRVDRLGNNDLGGKHPQPFPVPTDPNGNYPPQQFPDTSTTSVPIGEAAKSVGCQLAMTMFKKGVDYEAANWSPISEEFFINKDKVCGAGEVLVLVAKSTTKYWYEIEVYGLLVSMAKDWEPRASFPQDQLPDKSLVYKRTVYRYDCACPCERATETEEDYYEGAWNNTWDDCSKFGRIMNHMANSRTRESRKIEVERYNCKSGH